MKRKITLRELQKIFNDEVAQYNEHADYNVDYFSWDEDTWLLSIIRESFVEEGHVDKSDNNYQSEYSEKEDIHKEKRDNGVKIVKRKLIKIPRYVNDD